MIAAPGGKRQAASENPLSAFMLHTLEAEDEAKVRRHLAESVAFCREALGQTGVMRA